MAPPTSTDQSPAHSSPRSHSQDSRHSSNPASVQEMNTIPAEAPLPPFLRQPRSDVHSKFIDLEWQQRNRLAQAANSTDPASQWARVSGEEVLKRNRYLNVDPFVNNRVRLRVPEGQSDYINASPIALKTTNGVEENFIATQGPKEGSHSHIWHMLYHETTSPAVIVMLTQTHESGKEKCFQYFPPDLSQPTQQINEDDEFADGFTATLTLLSLTEDERTRSTIREMELKPQDGEARKVWHLLFAGWPDFLIPEGEDRAALLRLVRLSAALLDPAFDPRKPDASSSSPAATFHSHTQNPRTVHCSAGVGRSGTFIALDFLLAEMEGGAYDGAMSEEEDPVADVVDRLRQQRMMMVQGEQQFAFLYDVLREAWIERWRAKNGIEIPASTKGGEGGEGGQGKGNGVDERERWRLELEKEMRENAEKL